MHDDRIEEVTFEENALRNTLIVNEEYAWVGNPFSAPEEGRSRKVLPSFRMPVHEGTRHLLPQNAPSRGRGCLSRFAEQLARSTSASPVFRPKGRRRTLQCVYVAHQPGATGNVPFGVVEWGAEVRVDHEGRRRAGLQSRIDNCEAGEYALLSVGCSTGLFSIPAFLSRTSHGWEYPFEHGLDPVSMFVSRKRDGAVSCQAMHDCSRREGGCGVRSTSAFNHLSFLCFRCSVSHGRQNARTNLAPMLL